MKKTLFILTMVAFAACNNETKTVCVDSTKCDSVCADSNLMDSIGINQIKQMDSLQAAGKL
jgi:hypothetical protein